MSLSPANPSPQASLAQPLLLACGNPLRGDDGVGWRIADTLAITPSTPPLHVILSQQLLPEHAEPISAADLVIFVDCSALTPHGVVSVIQIEPASSLPRIFTHHLDPASLLRLTVDLYGRIPSRSILVTVGGQEFELSEELSPPVAAAIPAAIALILREFQLQQAKNPAQQMKAAGPVEAP